MIKRKMSNQTVDEIQVVLSELKSLKSGKVRLYVEICVNKLLATKLLELMHRVRGRLSIQSVYEARSNGVLFFSHKSELIGKKEGAMLWLFVSNFICAANVLHTASSQSSLEKPSHRVSH